MRTKIWLPILLILLIVQLVACDKQETESLSGRIEPLSGRIKENTITESEAIDLVKRTYEFAYIQGANDALQKYTERINGGRPITMQYFMDLKEKRLQDFLGGK